MTRSELINKLAADNPNLLFKDIECVVNTVFTEIGEALADGERVELRGFGAFSVKEREARIGRNPRTGESVHVGVRHSIMFKPGKQLREDINAQAGKKMAGKKMKKSAA